MSYSRETIGATAGQSRRRRHQAALLLFAILAPACSTTAPGAPGAPTGLTAAQGDALVALGWTASPGATSYRVKRATATGGPYATVATNVTATAYANTGLTNGTPYFFVVSAENNIGEGADSSEATATPAVSATAPAAPTGLSALAGDSQVSLLWNGSAGAATYTVSRSIVSGSGYAPLAAGTNIVATNFIDATAVNTTPYFYVVSATNTVGTSANSTQATATPAAPGAALSAPTGLSAVAGDTMISLAWNSVANAATYTLKRGTAAGGPYGTTVATGLTITTFDNVGLTNGTPYFYVVQAVTPSLAPSANSAEATATPIAAGAVPSAPTGLAAAGGNGHVDLSWNETATAATYTVLRSGTSGSGYVALPAGTGLTTTIFTDATALNTFTYFYVVRAVNTAGASGNSNEATATPAAPPPVPTAPPSLAAASGNAQIVLTWTAAIGTAPITYNIKRGTVTTGPYTTIATGIVPVTYTDTTAINGTTYFYVVTAQNPGGPSANSTEASATPLAPPTTLAATGATSQVSLTWVASIGATGYNVKRSTTSGSGYATLAAGTNVAGSPFTDLTAVNGTAYFYVVTAIKTTSESANSNEATATPLAAPTGVTAVASAGQVALTWSAVTGATSYTVKRGTVSTGPYGTTFTLGNVTSYPDTTAVNGTTFFYVIIAVNASGQSTTSLEVSGTPLAGPTGVTALAGTTQITLNWTTVSGATSYNVKRGPSGGPYVTVGSPGVNSFPDGGLTNGTTYFYVVTAVNGASESAISSQVSGTPIAAPTTLAATSSGGNTVGLTWAAATGATGYTVMRGIVNLGPYGTTFVLGNVTSYSDTTATNGTTYYYVVVGTNANGSSNSSNQAAATPLAAPTNIVPTGSDTHISFAWTAVAGATGYNVKRSGSPGGPYSTVGSPPTNSFDNTGLVNGTTYYYVISATNSTTVNEGPNSSPETPATPVGPPAAPTGLAATAGNGAVALSWTAPAGSITSYNVLIGTASTVYGAPGPFTGITTTFTTIGSLTNATQYFFVVQAVGPGGTSANSLEVSSTPTAGVPVAPNLISAVAGNAKVDLTWGASGGATSYTVKRGTTNGGPYGTTFVLGNVLTYSDTTALNGTTYYYVVTALNGAPESLNSNQLSATPLAPPAAPTGATAAGGNNLVTLNWVASSGATNYNVKRGTVNGGPYPTVFALGNVTTYPDASAVNGTTYYYVITAVNSIGGEGSPSSQVTATALAAPTGVAASGATGQVTLSWVAAAGATSYTVKRGTVSTGPYGTTFVAGNVTTYPDNTAVNGTTYFYVIQATATNSQSINSSEVTATPLAAPTGVAANGGDNQVTLSWNTVTGATGYNVKRGTTNLGPYGTTFAVGNVTSYPDTTALNGTPYFYVITATKGITNESTPSGQVTATPTAGPDVSSVPANGSPSIAIDSDLVFTFTTSMNKASVMAHLSVKIGVTPVQFIPVWDTGTGSANGTILTLVFDTVAPLGAVPPPEANFATITGNDLLADNTTYDWAFTSGSQNAALTQTMGAKNGNFTTVLDTTPPTITSITPDPRTAVLNGPGTTSFVIVFNEPMDTTTGSNGVSVDLQRGNNNVNAFAGAAGPPMSVTWGPSNTLTVGLPAGLLTNVGYRLQFQNLRDAHNNYINNNPEFSIITAGSDAVRPTITFNYPASGATAVSRDTQIFIGLKELMAPNFASKISISYNPVPATPTPFSVNYRVEKAGTGEPLNVSLTPLRAWPASTQITVTVDKSAADSSGNTLSASTNYAFTFTTGAGSTNISIDDPFSTLKNNMVDISPNNTFGGTILVKDGTGARAYLDASPTGLSMADVSITDPSGRPIKGYSINLNNSNNEDPAGAITISRGSSSGITALQFNTAYTLTFKSTIKSSTGGTFPQTVYTFTTMLNGGSNGRPILGFVPNSNFSNDPSDREVDLQLSPQDPDGPTLSVSVADDVDVAFNKALNPPGGGSGNFFYTSSGNETQLTTNGNHTFTYTIGDGFNVSHQSTVKERAYFFANADFTTFTPGALSGPSLTPTYNWTGSAPASCTVLVLGVTDTTSGASWGWIIPRNATSFAQPADYPLTAGHNYEWRLGLFHSLDGTGRDNGTFGQCAPTVFVR